MIENKVRIAAVVLASGMSKRMGELKQLLPFEGRTLLEHTIQKLLSLPFAKIYTIVGNRSDEIMDQVEIKDPRFEWRINRNYREGQSAALKIAAMSVHGYDGMMVFLGDQPLIRRNTIEKVLECSSIQQGSHQANGIVVQPSYSGKKGHPVFFSKELFPSFEMLEGDEGGKRLIHLASHHGIVPVDDPGILMDIDTPEDYQLLLKKEYGGKI